ncbi:MAG: tetratricopeptide repeat protein [Verrucomicrobia bacterium]|nr:tetratricopeptide repeat protein [Verrucomicrobiota bacterium]
MRTTLGEVYMSLGQKREATEMHREALRLARQNAELGPTKVIDSLVSLGWILNQSGQPPAADPLLREALALAGLQFEASSPKITWIKCRLGWNLMDLGRLDEAEPLCREALEKARKHWNGTDESQAELQGSMATYATGLAYVMQLRGRTAEAEELFREAVDAARRDKGENHPDLSGWIKNLATFLRGEGRPDEAEVLYRKAWELDKTHAPNHPRQIGAAGNLALLMRERGDDDEADMIISKLIAAANSLPEADRLSWANNLAAVGVNAATYGHWKDAAELLGAAKESGADSERLPIFQMAVAWQMKDTQTLQKTFSDYLAGLNKGGKRVLALDFCVTLAVWPSTDTDAPTLQRLAECARDSTGSAEWNSVAQALANCRLGQFDSAAELSRKVGEADAGPRAAAHLILALCQQRTDRRQEARASLAAGREALSAWAGADIGSLNRKWLDGIIVKALLQEAQALVETAASPKAP